MLFQDVVGQDELKIKIRNLINKNQLPHSILLLGREGTGGLPMARAMAQYLMCSNRGETEACNECSNCTKVKNLQHPDLHFSFPFSKTDDSKRLCNDYYPEFRRYLMEHPYAAEHDWIQAQEQKNEGKNKQGNITAEECRDIIRKLFLRTYESSFKVLILWRPEYLGNEGNILLKFLEEPTAKTILILVAENQEQILPTILSRTQLFPLRRLQQVEIQSALERKGLSEAQAHRLARLSDGNYHQALHLLQDQEQDYLLQTRSWLNAVFQNNGLALLQWIEEMNEGNKESQKNFLLYLIQLLEHALRFRQLGAAQVELPEPEQKVVETLLAKGITDYRIDQIAALLNEAVYQIERNANTKILFHALSLRIQQVIRAKTESATA